MFKKVNLITIQYKILTFKIFIIQHTYIKHYNKLLTLTLYIKDIIMKVKTMIKSGPGSAPCPNCSSDSMMYFSSKILNYQFLTDNILKNS